MIGKSYFSVRALVCAVMLLSSAVLLPANLGMSLPDAYAKSIHKSPEKKEKDAKIDSEILKIRNQVLSRKEAFSATSADDDIRVVLELEGRASSSQIKELKKLDVRIEGRWNGLVQASVPAVQLDSLAKLEFVRNIRQPLYVVPNSISEGANMIGADEIKAAGFTGQDIKVAIIDTGFDIANPETAANIAEAKSFRADRNISTSDPRHGTAVAEIIVDVAPGIQLYLYNVDTDVSLLTAMDYIVQKHAVNIVSMSLELFNAGPYDGTSKISQAVNAVRNSGILFVTAAGNEAQRHWEGNFVDSDSNGWRNFSGANETIGIDAKAGQMVDVFLSWNDWPSSTQDYDLYVFSDPDHLNPPLAFSKNPQFLGYKPTEHIAFLAPATGTYHIGIFNYNATKDVTFDLFSSVNLKEYNVQSGSLTIPSDATGAFTVGAVFWKSGLLEAFSSRGPTKDGRTKPDISGLDGVTTST